MPQPSLNSKRGVRQGSQFAGLRTIDSHSNGPRGSVPFVPWNWCDGGHIYSSIGQDRHFHVLTAVIFETVPPKYCSSEAMDKPALCSNCGRR